MLAEDAIKAAVKDYEAKRVKATASGEATTAEKTSTAWFLHCLEWLWKQPFVWFSNAVNEF